MSEINKHDFWSQFSQSIQMEWQTAASVLQVKRGETIYQRGDTPKGIYFVREGLIGLTILGMSGKEHLLRFFRKGQFLGHRSLFSEESYHATTTALEQTELILVPKSVVLKTLTEQPQYYRPFVEVLSKELRRCEVQRIMVLENQVLSRTAQSLIYLKDLHPDHIWTRQEIANFCASTVSTVIKALAKIEDMGLIAQKGRSIEIIDREGLLQLEENGI